jgi:outer membrane lipoprotein-sorting protein
MFRESRKLMFLFSALTLLMAFICVDVSAQYAGYKPVSDIPAVKKAFASGAAKINSLSSTFKQEKILTALDEKIVSNGNFKFKRPNKLRIEYTSPYKFLLIMNGDKIIVKDDQNVSQVNAGSNRLFQQINRIMIDCMQGTILESKDFTAKLFESDNNYLLELTPVSHALRDFFATIVLTVGKDDYSVEQIEMNEPAGDQTIMTFKKKEINTPLADAVFTF